VRIGVIGSSKSIDYDYCFLSGVRIKKKLTVEEDDAQERDEPMGHPFAERALPFVTQYRMSSTIKGKVVEGG